MTLANRQSDEPRGLRRIDILRFSRLDLTLGIRMLVKFPFISAVGVLALAMAIAIGVIFVEMVVSRVSPTLPFDDGRRIVRLDTWHAARLTAGRPSPHDFLAWRSRLTSVVELGAYRTFERNVVAADGLREPERVAEISPSAFRVTRVPVELGRPLIAEDERVGAPDVVVIGHDLWVRRFRRDPGVVGSTVQVGRARATVVGVMPKGFGFPHNQELWVPLRLAAVPPADAEALDVFGRLAARATLESARAELSAVGLAPSSRVGDERLRPRVRPFVGPAPGESVSLGVLLGYAAVLFVLLAASVNVSTLVLARTALRETEIAVRTALGATRQRVFGQLIGETLVLAGAAAVAGLALAGGAIKAIWWYDARFTDEPPPFWMNDTLEPSTVLLTVVLAVIGAAVIALIPAIKATGARTQASLQLFGGGHTSIRFGGLWSFVIVAQVALTVVSLPIAIGISRETVRDYQVRSAFPAAQYLTFQLQLDRESASDDSIPPDDGVFQARLTGAFEDLKRRLAEEPGVDGVTFGTRLPGTSHPLHRIETQRGAEPPAVLRANMDGWVNVASVDRAFFDVFRVPVVAGQAFGPGDDSPTRRVVIVNESFARNLGGGSALGVRVRYAARDDEPPGAWHEIIGVVRNIDMEPTDLGEADFLFHPASPATARPLTVAVHVRGGPAQFAPRLSDIAKPLDPALRLYELRPMDEVVRRRFLPIVMLTMAATVVVGIAVLLSAAGLFALMSVAVARRTREIAIRLTLGAARSAVLSAVFGRAARQLGAGILIGNALIVLLILAFGGDVSVDVAVPLLAVSGLMGLVGLLACLAPMRRALAVQPTEALRLG